MNNIYEYCFNFVCDDWEENRPEWYNMVFEPAWYRRASASVYKEHFIFDVADTILKNKPFFGNISMRVIENYIEKRRHEIAWNKCYSVYVEHYDSDYDYTDSDDD